MTNMKLEHYVVGPVETNCYLVTNTKTNELIVIDPGEEADMLISKIKASGAKPAAILLTHAHFDHITGAAASSVYSSLPLQIRNHLIMHSKYDKFKS
mgnify:CR=1 FL=1